MPGLWDNDSSSADSQQSTSPTGGLWGGTTHGGNASPAHPSELWGAAPAQPSPAHLAEQQRRVEELNHSQLEKVLHPGSISPESWWEHLWAAHGKPATGKALSNVNTVFNWLDTPLTAAHAAMMAPKGQRAGAALEAAHQAIDEPIRLVDVVGSSRAPFAKWLQKHPAAEGMLGAGEEMVNPANLLGPGIGMARRGMKPVAEAIGESTAGSGLARIFDPLAGANAAERSQAQWLSQEFAHAGKDATAKAVELFRGIPVEDREMVSHLVESMKPNPSEEDQFMWANAMHERPDLIRKAQEIEQIGHETGLRKGLVDPERGHMPHRPKEERPEMVPVQTQRGTIMIPLKDVATPGGIRRSRRFSSDPGSMKAQKMRSLTEIAKNPATVPETDAAKLTQMMLESARKHEAMGEFGKRLEAGGHLKDVEFVDPKTGRIFPNWDAYEKNARMRGREMAGVKDYSGVTPFQYGRVVGKHKGGIADPEAAEMRAMLKARQSARVKGAAIASAIMKRSEAIPEPGMRAFSNSPHLAEQLRGKQARESLVRFVDNVGGGDSRQTIPAVKKFFDMMDTWNSGVRVGIIANVAYHPLFNIMPQFESAVGRHSMLQGAGLSAPAVFVKNFPSLTRFARAAAKGPTSIYEHASPALRTKLDHAREFGALAAIGETNKVETLLAPGISMRNPRDWLAGINATGARAWDWNNRMTFGVDDVYSAELFDALTKQGVPEAEAAHETRNALGRYGAAFESHQNLSRLFFFFPWMQTMARHWLGGPGLENLKPMMSFHGYQSNYNKAVGSDNPNPMAIGNTVLPMPWRLLSGTINDPVKYPAGWFLGHATPGIEVPLALALNASAPFSAAARDETGAVKPWAQIATPGAPEAYKDLERGRYAAEQAIPFGGQIERAIQGYQNQGMLGIGKGLMGALPLPQYDPLKIKLFNQLQTKLRRKQITFDEYRDELKALDSMGSP